MNCALPGCRSNFSLLWGTAFPDQLAARAAERNISHLGLADTDNLYGAVDFSAACRDAGIHPLIGVRLSTALGPLHLIAKNYAGYQNLCRLVTARKLDAPPDKHLLLAHAEHLACLAPASAAFDDLTDIYDHNLYLSVEGYENRRVYDIIQRRHIRPVANPTVAFLDPDDYRLHLLLRAIDSGSLLDSLNGTPRDGPGCFFPDPNLMARRFSHMPEAIAGGLHLARQCEVNFPEHKNLLPGYPDYDGDRAEHLRAKALDGLHRKRSPLPGSYLARLDFELAVINRTGFTDYFLIVSGIVDHCRHTGIPVVGRGSAAGSIVAWALDITQVDPIREGLYFERFLNEARSDPPDIDLDIDWRRRDDVLNYVYDRYGRDRTAMIASYTRFRSRLAVREVAKAVGMPPGDINRLAKRLPRVDPAKIVNAVKTLSPAERAGINAERFGAVIRDAALLDNFPRHLGIHPGGIVITPTPLTDYVALEQATKGLVVTQCDMYQAEKLGLVKIDILGQRGQAVIVDCLTHARQTAGDDFTIPDRDPAATALLQSAKTIGVFQIESPGLRSLLRDIKPAVLNDITLALALIRPGASDSGMKKVFLDCHHGLRKATYPDPRLENILKETHGVFIYQEQVLLCARAIAGFNLPAADLLRRAITKDRRGGHYKKLARRFLDGAVKNGLPRKKAAEIFKLLSLFAGFGFCKAHAATYGYLAYQSAYFKAHYPAPFMTAVLNNDGGYYPAAAYIAEARRLGITIAPPDINISDTCEALVRDTIYIGLHRVRDLERATIDRIIAERPFSSFDDFLTRVRLSAGEAENLVKIGAFDAIDDTRPRLLWRLRMGRRRRRPVRGALTFDGSDTRDDMFAGHLLVPRARHLPPLPDITPFERFCYEKEILGLSATAHPLTLLPEYNRLPFSSIRDGNPKNGTRVTIDGWLTDIKKIKTREEKKTMLFLTFEDLEDTFEVVLFPDRLQKLAPQLTRRRFFRITGEINIDGGAVAIIARDLAPAPTGLSEQPYI